MIKTDSQFIANVDEIEPALVRREDGWRHMDIRFIVTRESGSQNLTLFRTVFQPGAAHEVHIHPHADEFLYVIRGRAAIGCEDQEHIATPGTVQFIRAGKTHWLRNLDPQEPVELVGGYVGGASLEEAGYRFISEITDEHQRVG